MRIKAITIGKAMTCNMGNYESARAEVSMTADINEDDVLEDAVQVLSRSVTVQLLHEVEKFIGIEQVDDKTEVH